MFSQDAGVLISDINPLREVRRILTSEGFVTTYSSGTVEQWTHPGMLQYLGITQDETTPDGETLLQSSNLSGQIFGVRYDFSSLLYFFKIYIYMRVYTSGL